MNNENMRKPWDKVAAAMPTVDRLTKNVGGGRGMLPIAVICANPGSRLLERLMRIGAKIAAGPDGSVVAVLPLSQHFVFSAEFPSEGIQALIARAAGQQLVLVQTATQILRLQVPPCPRERATLFGGGFHGSPLAAA